MTESFLQCKECKAVKRAQGFHVDRKSRTGFRSVCKECAATYHRSNRERILARKREIWPEYRAANAEARKESSRQYRRENAAKIAAREEEYKQRYPLKYKARTEAHNAIKLGKLTPDPCEVCGNPAVDAHHDDYLMPLEVRWLCREHHAQWHAQNGPGQNGDLTIEEVKYGT